MTRRLLLAAFPLLACSDDGTAASSGGSSSGTDTDTDTSDSLTTTTMSTSETMSTSVGPTTASSSTTTTTTDPTGSTGADCFDNDDCTDPDNPFCVNDVCTTCDATGIDAADQNEACSGRFPDTPVCQGSTCVACNDTYQGYCTDQNLLCDGETFECILCTAHSECGDALACHLDPASDQAGQCFDMAEDTYVDAANVTQLANAFSNLSVGDDVVVSLNGTDYNAVDISFTTDAEVVLLGNGNQNLTGNTAGGIIQTGGSAILYVDSLNLASNLAGNILDCSGTSVWIDNSTIEGADAVGLDISGDCAAHVRGSTVTGNTGNAIVVNGNASSISLVNSFATADVDRFVVDVIDGSADILYSSLGANFGTSAGLRCNAGGDATVRNSIVVSRSGDAEISCANLTLSDSATETNLGGNNNQVVGAMQTDWFGNYNLGDLHLQGGHPFNAVAMWQDGDPLFDIDDDPRAGMDGEMELPGADLP